MGFRFSPCGCCGETGCLQFTDDFDRADSDSLGGSWDERAGDFDIVSNKLSTASVNGLCLHTGSHPSSLADVGVQATIRATTAGDKARLIVAYADDDNYAFVEIEFGETIGCVRTFNRVAGVNTQVGDTIPDIHAIIDNDYQMQVYYRGATNNLSAAAERVAGASFERTLTATGDQCGVGTGDTVAGTITFDDFEYWVCSGTGHWCLPCGISGGPGRLSVEISGLTGSSGSCIFDFNGTWLFDFYAQDANSCTWRHDTGSPGDGIWLYIYKPSGTTYGLRITFNAPSICPHTFLTFEKTITLPADFDCVNFAAYSVPRLFLAPGTAEITAVAC